MNIRPEAYNTYIEYNFIYYCYTLPFNSNQNVTCILSLINKNVEKNDKHLNMLERVISKIVHQIRGYHRGNVANLVCCLKSYIRNASVH